MAWVTFNEMRRCLIVLTIVVNSAEGSSRALELIKRPVIRSLLEKDSALVALRRQTFWQRRNLKDIESAAAAAEEELAGLIPDDLGYTHWGMPLISYTFAPVELALFVALFVLFVGMAFGLFIARSEADKKLQQQAADRAAAEVAARAAACAQPPTDKSLYRKSTNHARAAALQTVEPLPPQPHSEPPTDGGLRGNHGVSAPTLSATSSHTLLKPKEHHPTSSAAYQQHMARLSANSAQDEGQTSPDGTTRELLQVNDNTNGKELAKALTADGGEIGSAALAVTEKHTPETTVYDGSEMCTDLFQGQHPPPLPLRSLEELLAFAHALLQGRVPSEVLADEQAARRLAGPSRASLQLVRAKEARAATANLPTAHLLSGSSLVVGNGPNTQPGDLPSLHSSGESALSTADRLRGAAEALLAQLNDNEDSVDDTEDRENAALKGKVVLALAERSLATYERVLAGTRALSRPHVAYSQGVCLVLLGRFHDAQRLFDVALSGGPHKARAWHAKGKLFARQGDLAGAQYCLQRALELVNAEIAAAAAAASPSPPQSKATDHQGSAGESSGVSDGAATEKEVAQEATNNAENATAAAAEQTEATAHAAALAADLLTVKQALQGGSDTANSATKEGGEAAAGGGSSSPSPKTPGRPGKQTPKSQRSPSPSLQETSPLPGGLSSSSFSAQKVLLPVGLNPQRAQALSPGAAQLHARTGADLPEHGHPLPLNLGVVGVAWAEHRAAVLQQDSGLVPGSNHGNGSNKHAASSLAAERARREKQAHEQDSAAILGFANPNAHGWLSHGDGTATPRGPFSPKSAAALKLGNGSSSSSDSFHVLPLSPSSGLASGSSEVLPPQNGSNSMSDVSSPTAKAAATRSAGGGYHGLSVSSQHLPTSPLSAQSPSSQSPQKGKQPSLASALAPTHELEGWEKKPVGFYRAGQADHSSAAEAAALGVRPGEDALFSAQNDHWPAQHGSPSDLFARGGLGQAYIPGQGAAPFHSGDQEGSGDFNGWLPPFTVEIMEVFDVQSKWTHQDRHGGCCFEVVATVVEEVSGARPSKDQQPLPNATPKDEGDATGDTMNPTVLSAVASSVNTQLQHVYQTVTQPAATVGEDTNDHEDIYEEEEEETSENSNAAAGNSSNNEPMSATSKVSFASLPSKSSTRGAGAISSSSTTTTVAWSSTGGLVTVVGAKSSSLLVFTLMRRNTGEASSGTCVGQVAVPLCGLPRALNLVQGRIVLEAAAPLEAPLLWLRHDAPSSSSSLSSSSSSPATQKTSPKEGTSQLGSPHSGGFVTPGPGGKGSTHESSSFTSGSSRHGKGPGYPSGTGRGVLAFRVHLGARLDTLYSSRIQGCARLTGGLNQLLQAPQHNACKALPCTLARLHVKTGSSAAKPERAVGVEDPYMLALTADRLLAMVYDELTEPRSFKGAGQANTQGTAAAAAAEPHAFAAPTIQAHDSFSKAVFATQGAPPGLFALRHNREFPLRRLTTIKEVSSTDDPRLELSFSLHATDALEHGHHPSDRQRRLEEKVLSAAHGSASSSGLFLASPPHPFGDSHTEDLIEVAVSLRFHHGGAAQQRMWATALRAACEHLPGALLGLNHKSSEVDGAHNRLLAPVAATKHLLFAPLSIMKHQVNQHKEASGSSSKSSAGKQKAESGGAAAPAVSTMAGKLDAAAE